MRARKVRERERERNRERQRGLENGDLQSHVKIRTKEMFLSILQIKDTLTYVITALLQV